MIFVCLFYFYFFATSGGFVSSNLIYLMMWPCREGEFGFHVIAMGFYFPICGNAVGSILWLYCFSHRFIVLFGILNLFFLFWEYGGLRC